jgi:hypothetical protein
MLYGLYGLVGGPDHEATAGTMAANTKQPVAA